MRPAIDSNIVIDALSGKKQAIAELERYQKPWISVITRMEVLAFHYTASEEKAVKSFLSQYFTEVPLDDQVASVAIDLRRTHKLKLPDAVIWATAKVKETILVTRNTKDFSKHAPDIRVPYSA